mmetsp:Transcript_5804/g.10419  ORF Transcript_5804/g.10419 Transcript_5804/m.10419 type:complete len:226 (+) Transcript_5804:844-1521(+)
MFTPSNWPIAGGTAGAALGPSVAEVAPISGAKVVAFGSARTVADCSSRLTRQQLGSFTEFKRARPCLPAAAGAASAGIAVRCRIKARPFFAGSVSTRRRHFRASPCANGERKGAACMGGAGAAALGPGAGRGAAEGAEALGGAGANVFGPEGGAGDLGSAGTSLPAASTCASINAAGAGGRPYWLWVGPLGAALTCFSGGASSSCGGLGTLRALMLFLRTCSLSL